MTLPKGYRPHEGDILVVHGRVQFDVDAEDAGVHLIVAEQTYRSLLVPLDAVIDLYCRA